MHHICSANCDTYSISPTTLSNFLTWLQGRTSRGTVVQTMGQVMGVGAPPPPPPNPVPAIASLSPISTRPRRRS